MFADWLNQFAYVGRGAHEGTIEEAVLYFFYEGLNPFIRRCGYTWLNHETNIVARKFLYLCYMIQSTPSDNDLVIPGPRHRDLSYDRDTFDFAVDTFTFNDFLSNWSFCNHVCGTRFDYLIKEFCYTWVNVESGPPGKMTQKALDAEKDEEEEEMLYGPEITSKKKFDLY